MHAMRMIASPLLRGQLRQARTRKSSCCMLATPEMEREMQILWNVNWHMQKSCVVSCLPLHCFQHSDVGRAAGYRTLSSQHSSRM